MCRKIKSHATITQIYNQTFSKLKKEKVTQRHSLKPKTNKNFKKLLGEIMSTVNTVEFVVRVFSNSIKALP